MASAAPWSPDPGTLRPVQPTASAWNPDTSTLRPAANDPLVTGKGMMQAAQSQARPTSLPEPKPGFVSRAGQAMGLTQTTDPASEFASFLTDLRQHPAQEFLNGAKQLAMAPVNLTYQATHHPLDTSESIMPVNRAIGDVKAGNYGAATGDIAGGVANTVALAQATKALPEIANNSAALLSKGGIDPVEAVRSSAENAITKIARGIGVADPEPPALMTKAVKPLASNIGWEKAIQTAMPNMKAAEADLGHPIQGVDDALDAVGLAKKQIWSQYAQKLQAGSDIGATIDGNQIADAMMQSIDKRTSVQNPDLADHIASVADTYRRQIPLDEAEDFLQSANRDLHNYYAKNKVGQQVALSDPEKAYTVAEATSLRGALYDKLDDVAGEGSADMKRQYGALSNVDNELLRRQNVAARQQPMSLSEQLTNARAYGKIAKGVLTASPGDVIEGVRSAAMAKYLKERFTTDAMITRAFAKTGVPTSSATPAVTRPPVAGLLPSGPMFTPPPADASGPTKLPTPAVTATTRAQRLGLLLPEKTGLVTPPTTSESGVTGVNAPATLQRNPNTGRIQRVYLGTNKP